MPKLSVLIAQYNTIKYLPRFYECLRKQQFADYELLVLDDISTDGSFEFAQKLSVNDKRIKVFRASEKMLPDKARAFLFKKAQGKYVLSVDSDDLISENYFSNLIESAEKNDSDIVVSTNCRIDENDKKRTKKQFPFNKNNHLLTEKERLSILKCKYGGWNRMCKKDFLIKNGYDYSQAELPLFIMQFYANTKVSTAINGTYFYRMRGGSISTSKVPQRIADYNALEPLDWCSNSQIIEKRYPVYTYVYRMILPYLFYKKSYIPKYKISDDIRKVKKHLDLSLGKILHYSVYLNFKDFLITIIFAIRLDFIPKIFIKKFRS
ncbi:MAG: glycosyltransferase family 2 protein [Candidatus Izemoplasmatales bacterium]|nr:glycosyltransferase family 2 protein [Candidatus Izemoplasmatales bacterium]